MIQLFYATGNPNKIHNMVYRLRAYPVQIVTPKDLNIHLDIQETGTSAVENALLKASGYYKYVGMPTIAGDSGMYIDGLPADRQPGLYVRRVGGKVLTDDEMIAYYSGLAKSVKGDCFIRYFTGIALITSHGTFTKEWCDTPLKLSPVPNRNRKHKGNPLDVISLLDDGRYFNDLSDAERVSLDQKGEQAFTNFILDHLLAQ